MSDRRVLDNWKEIAAYLGRTGKTCRNWEKEYGLPVHRLDGSPRAHVFAYPDEIDRWKEEMLREESAASREITIKFSLKKLFVPAAIGLLAVAAALAVYLRSRGPRYDPKRIIIAIFENQTGDKSHDVLGRIASDWITQGVSRAGIADVVDAPPGEAAPGTPQEAERIRAMAREAEAGTLVSGAYFLQGNTLNFHARVSDMSNGKVIKALDPVSGAIEEPVQAIDLMRQKVLGALAEILDPRTRPLLPFSGQPPNYEAYNDFIAGAEALARADNARAIEFYLRAAALDPSFKKPLLAATIAYSNLGQYAAGEKLLGEVDKVRDALGPIDKLTLDHQKAFYRGDLAGQLRISRQWAPRMKGDFLYSWGLDAYKNNRPREAVKALSMLDPQGLWGKASPYYWVIMTEAEHMLGRYRTELKKARRARRQFPEVPSACWEELRALAALGRIQEIDDLADQLVNIKFDRSYQRGITPYIPSRLMSVTGRALRAHGFKRQSLPLFDRAIRWLQERPDEDKTKKVYREAVGQAYYFAEKWPEAQVFYEGLLKEDPENLSYLKSCGAIAARMGEREKALRISGQLEEIKKPYLWGLPAYHRACIASLLGEKETAVRLLREAVSQGMWSLYLNLHEDMDLEPLRDYPPFQELIKPKG